jgi:hypothetical protein
LVEGHAFEKNNATCVFFGTMNEIFEKEVDNLVKCFLEDIKVHGLDWKQHLRSILSGL